MSSSDLFAPIETVIPSRSAEKYMRLDLTLLRPVSGRPSGRIFLLVTLACAMLAPARATPPDVPDGVLHAPIAIVVSSRWPGTAPLDLKQLRRIYLGRVTSIAGVPIRPRQRDSNSEIFRQFAMLVLHMNPRQVEEFWIEQGIKGGVRRFPSFRSAGSLLSNVARVRGAIGYLAAWRVERRAFPGVRVLGVLEGGRVRPPDGSSSRPAAAEHGPESLP